VAHNNGVVRLWNSNPPGSAAPFIPPRSYQRHFRLAHQCVGDFTGNGKVDVLWRNDNGNLSLWIHNPPGSCSHTATRLLL
jgi:hypothetical protein